MVFVFSLVKQEREICLPKIFVLLIFYFILGQIFACLFEKMTFGVRFKKLNLEQCQGEIGTTKAKYYSLLE